MRCAKNTIPTKPVAQFDSEKGLRASLLPNGTIASPVKFNDLTMEDICAFLESGESDTVDFKGEQYPIIGDRKSVEKEADFLKDVLAMANTPREREAFILIGVKEKQHLIPGIPVDQVIDASTLNGKIKSKTNIQVPFRTYSVPCKSGNVVQVFALPPHGDHFPFYLQESFPAVKPSINAKTVYYRQGTSNTEASIEDVVRLTREWFNLRNRPAFLFEIESPNRMSDGRLLTFDLEVIPRPNDRKQDPLPERILAAKTGFSCVKLSLRISNRSPLCKADVKVRFSLIRTDPRPGVPVDMAKAMSGKWWEDWKLESRTREEELLLYPGETRKNVCPLVFDMLSAGRAYLRLFISANNVGVIVDREIVFEIVRGTYVCDCAKNQQVVLPNDERALFDSIRHQVNKFESAQASQKRTVKPH